MPIVELIPQGGGFRNADIAPGAAIDATKVVHQTSQSFLVFPAATAVTNLLYPLAIIASETAEIVTFEAAVFTAASAMSDRTLTVDLQKSTGGSAFATIMSDLVDFDATSTARTVYNGVISDIDLEEGDVLQAVVSVAGADGTQATGLLVTLTTRERPTT